MQTQTEYEALAGMSVEELRQKADEHLWIQGDYLGDADTEDHFRILVEGDGINVKDIYGNTYIDAIAGAWLVNVGHGRKEIADAVYDQIKRLHYSSAWDHANIPAIKLAAKLAEITPGSLSKVFFSLAGSQAVETAMKIARQYHVHNGSPHRFKVIARRGSYHGESWGTLSICGDPGARAWLFEPLPPMGRHVDPIYCYRCPWDLKYPSCKIQCVKEFEKAIQFENPETVSAVIIEPISVSVGNQVPVDEYWPMLREICDKYGVLLIADEVITGFGRTGKMFACEHWGVVPDLMTMAKGLSSGYLPLAATIAKKEIADKFTQSGRRMLSQGITYGGHAVACAAALANIEIIERENLVENSAKMGAYMLERLKELDRHSIVGDVRGIGLSYCIELVKDKKTKERFPPEAGLDVKLTQKFKELGFLHKGGALIFLAPPLTVTKNDIDEIVGRVDRAIGSLEKELAVA